MSQDNIIPEYEVNWLCGLDESLIIKRSGGGSIYPITVLPPKLKAFVKDKNRNTEFISLSPSMGHADGMYWRINGWLYNETDSWKDVPSDWSESINALKEPPTFADIENKVIEIQSQLTALGKLLIKYREKL